MLGVSGPASIIDEAYPTGFAGRRVKRELRAKGEADGERGRRANAIPGDRFLNIFFFHARHHQCHRPQTGGYNTREKTVKVN